MRMLDREDVLAEAFLAATVPTSNFEVRISYAAKAEALAKIAEAMAVGNVAYIKVDT